ncbi:FAD-dependent oxidoreductase [Pseudomonas aeruginosa]|nr:FAD-dependent oxidoreductase [Pseudomonas aeruginosa]
MFDVRKTVSSLSLILAGMLTASAAFAESTNVSEALLRNFPVEEAALSPAVPAPKKVIVVGAGAAGLAAARILSDQGVETVVLEAGDRIGGRAWTADLNGHPVDMNGGFIHDLDINPLIPTFQQLGLKYTVLGSLADPSVGAYDAETGETLGLIGKARFVYHMYKYFGGPEPVPKAGADDYPIEQWMKSYVNDAELEGVDGHLIESLLRTMQSTDGSDYSMHWSRSLPVGGDEEVALPENGYAPFMHKLGDGLDIRLKHPVTRIIQSGDGVRVFAGGESFSGTHVLVTVSVGVLKKGLIEFEPSLPQAKVQAIESAGMSNMEKLVYLFDDKDAESLDFTTEVYSDSRTGVRITFVNISEQITKPSVAAIVHTDYVEKFSKLSQEDGSKLVLSALRQMTGHVDLTPKRVVQSDWTNNPFYKGAYSYIRVGSGPENIQALASPIFDGRVLFAGEATDVKRHQYVDGAVSSGVREARRLLRSK